MNWNGFVSNKVFSLWFCFIYPLSPHVFLLEFPRMWDLKGKLPFWGRKKKKEEKVKEVVYKVNDTLSPAVLAKKAFAHIEKLSMIGERPAASRSSRRTANNIASVFEGFTDSMRMDTVKIDPLLGTFWTKIIPFLMIISSLLIFFGLGYVSILVSVLSLFELFLEIVAGRSLLSRFMVKNAGHNVEAVLEAGKEASRTIIFSSHLDSARLENRAEDKLPLGFTMASIIYNLLISIAFTIEEIAKGIMLRMNIPSFLPFLAIIPSVLLSVLSLVKSWNFYSSAFSPGCGDNLSGVGVCLALSEYFSKNRPDYVRLVFLSFDGEECCRQGSLDYYKKNRFEGKVENINIDGLYRSEDLAVISREAVDRGIVDDGLAVMLGDTAKAMGYAIKIGKLDIFSGSTDASSARKYGISAATITCMTPGVESPAHTKGDVMQAIDLKTLEEAISIAVKYVNAADEKESAVYSNQGEGGSLLTGKRYKLAKIDD